MATTPSAIRDRAIAVIEALTATSDPGVKFRAYRNEGTADFQDWAEKNPAACRRRFQVRTTGGTFTPPISNTDEEEHQVTLSVLVAYPQTGRDGIKQALDRDDTLDEDAFQIDAAIGMLGRANFSTPYPDACWIEGTPIARIVGVAVDFVEFVLTYIYRRTRIAIAAQPDPPATPATLLGKLVLIAGQSNAVGHGDTDHVDRGLAVTTPYTSATIDTKISDGLSDPIAWTTVARRDLQPYHAGGASGMGPEISLGRYLVEYNGIASVVPMSKFAVGGTFITDWLPSGTVPAASNLYSQFIAYIDAQIAATGEQLGVLVWMQGDTDATDSAASLAYQANLTTLMAALRVRYGNFVLVITKMNSASSGSGIVAGYRANVQAAQAAYVATDSHSVLVDCDGVPNSTDNVHYDGDGLISVGNLIGEAVSAIVAPTRNTNRSSGPAPWIQSTNEPMVFGAGALSPRAPVHAAGDDLFLVVAMGLVDTPPSFSAANGYTLVDSKQSAFSGTQKQNLYVYRKRATAAGMPNPVLADNNDVNVAWIFAVRGAATSPIDVVSKGANDTYDTAFSIAGGTTLTANTLMLSIFAGYTGDVNLSISGWTNASITSFAEVRDSVSNIAGTGQAIALAAGTKATAGAYNSTIATPSNLSISAGLTIAIKP